MSCHTLAWILSYAVFHLVATGICIGINLGQMRDPSNLDYYPEDGDPLVLLTAGLLWPIALGFAIYRAGWRLAAWVRKRLTRGEGKV